MRGRNFFLALPLLVGLAMPPPAAADVSVQIGINVPVYPELHPVPDYPVYYAPGLPANYFFYDGLYWVYVNDSWYSSSWYNGPWYWVEPAFVPVYVLRVPVSYYRVPPPYFRSWAPAEPPRWGAYWGPRWETQHRGWNQWDRRHVPAPAPLPTYQRQYIGDRYPQREQQQAIRQQQYRYEPRDDKVRQRLAVETRSQPVAQRPAAPEQETPPPQAQQRREVRERDAQQQQQEARQQQQQAQQREARERDAQQQQQEARQQQSRAQQREAQEREQQQALERQAREREQAQTRQQQQQARDQQQEQARRQQEQARQQQELARQGQQQRAQQAQEQQQRQQQQMQERQRQAREQQQEQAERRAQRAHPPGRERRDGD
jgi:hypothetical protein